MRQLRHMVSARVAAAALAMIVATLVGAQTTSSIEGRVTDPSGGVIPGVAVRITDVSQAVDRQTLSDEKGVYRISGLPRGSYRVTASKSGFSSVTINDLELSLNRTVTYDFPLKVAALSEEVVVSGTTPLIETTNAASGATITPSQIRDVPINGRNYLDLLQLVPGVAVNRQATEGTDTAVAVLGERGNNTAYLIDGLPNQNQVDGGASAQFHQDSIYEFQVITSGFKAEFGRGSGAVVNVLTKSGSNDWHGQASVFMRNSVLDASNKPGGVPHLIRWDPAVSLGGPVVKDRVFMFTSFERIRESRQLNFAFPAGTPAFIQAREIGYNQNNQTYDTRIFAKLDEQLGRHRLTQQMNLTNNHVSDYLPLSSATNLPSTRSSLDSRTLMLGFTDNMALGNQSNPFLVTARFGYRSEPNTRKPSHPEAGPNTTFQMFSGLTTGQLLGDLGSVNFGAAFSPYVLRPQYSSAGLNAVKQVRRHNLKFGWEFEHILADGSEASNLSKQVFATVSDFLQFGPIYAGWGVPNTVAGRTAADNEIHLRNNYNGLYVQDDWTLSSKLTLNFGLRWDYDSTFSAKSNFSPRVGGAWKITPKSVLRGSFGIFYDHFRIGLARNIPAFGGANLISSRGLSYPRLFYGIPTTAPFSLDGLCLSPTLTDAQIAAQGLRCTASATLPLYGIDHLNKLVAAGHAPVPANAVVTINNVQQLTGLAPDQFLAAVNKELGRDPNAPTNYFFWNAFGTMASAFRPNAQVPITIDPGFRTPYTRAYNASFQQELGKSLALEVDYHHREMKNILGTRQINLDFSARINNDSLVAPGTGTLLANRFGPWYEGTYDGLSVAVTKRMGARYMLHTSYTFAHAIDNLANSNLRSELQSAGGANTLPQTGPGDNYVGIVPTITACGKTNANGPFVLDCGRGAGNPIPRAGSFYNGPDYDKGNSGLALSHIFLLHGAVNLPWTFQVSGILRAQSGFRFSRARLVNIDVDGNGTIGGYDETGRNAFEAPPYVNTDLRVSKVFKLGERVRVTGVLEFFNLFNRANPAAVQNRINVTNQPFGSVLQVLPGREGQVGLRIEF